MMKSIQQALVAAALCLAATSWVQAETIVNVLDRSQRMRLEAMHPADTATPQALKISASFDKVMQHMPPSHAVELRIVRGVGLAEAMQGHIVAVHESVGDLPETVQLFILAHELGHIAHSHWSQMGLLFLKWVPGEVVPQNTNAVSSQLGRDASALTYNMEFEADAFAMGVLRRMGYTLDDVTSVFACLGMYRDSPTHPSSFKRIVALRALWSRDVPSSPSSSSS